MTTVAAAKPSRKSLLTFNVKAVLQLQDSYATFWLLCWRISWWLFKFKDLHKYTMKNCPNYLDDKIIAQYLKITLNVAFEFWGFLLIFGELKVAGNTVWLQASCFKNSPKLTIFCLFKWDFLCEFQTLSFFVFKCP